MRDELVFFSNTHHRTHELQLSKPNSGANTEALIAMINGDRFGAAKQYLVNVLPLVKAAQLGGRNNYCDNCYAWEYSLGDTIWFRMDEPAWSNCAGCAVKLS